MTHTDGRTVYRLNRRGHRRAFSRSVYHRLRGEIRNLRLLLSASSKKFKVRRTLTPTKIRAIRIRATFLYYTGRMSYRNYRKLTIDWMNKSKKEIVFAYATHQITKKQYTGWMKWNLRHEQRIDTHNNRSVKRR